MKQFRPGPRTAIAREVGSGIEQTVDVVETQPLQGTVANEPEDQAMGMVEHVVAFHAEAGEIVDVEETTVVDLVARPPHTNEPST